MSAPKRWLPRGLGGLIAGLTAAAAATAAASPEPLSLAPCRLPGLAHEARCGSLSRPLDPQRPQGARFDLQVAVLPALARHPRADPVFFFAGGPGQSAIDLAPQVEALMGRLLNRHDIVLIDQRGTGGSAPLYCEPEARVASAARPLAQQIDPARQQQRLLQCLARLQTLPHGDLRQYTTRLAAADAEAVRQALGLGPVNLVGGSYGTRMGLEMLRQFPASVRRAVLDGVAPPDMVLMRSMSADSEAALDGLLGACEREPACARRWPGLRGRWQALLESLPRSVSVAHPLTGALEPLRLDREAVLSLVRGPLYAPALAAALPAAMAQAVDGQFGPLLALGGSVQAASGRHPPLSEGQHFSVVCAEDWPRLARSADRPGALFGRDGEARYAELCARWPRAEVPPEFYQLPPAPAGVLLLSGGADPVTPPRHGERVARALGPRAVHAVVPQAGHGVMALGCVRDAVARFIDEEDEARALAQVPGALRCAAGVPRPLAFQPAAAPPEEPAR